jgi:hypothetical protein
MNDREKAKVRTQMLKELREEHKDTVASTQERLKNQKKIYRDINKIIKDEPKTVPEIAEVTEAGMSGEYFRYGLTEEKK